MEGNPVTGYGVTRLAMDFHSAAEHGVHARFGAAALAAWIALASAIPLYSGVAIKA